jgi:two-component system, cell cycle response regulator DivK
MSATKRGDNDEAPLVLVVDDFEDNRAMYVEYLQFQGFRVAEAVNGEEAVERARALIPAVIIMDLSLPVMDGWEATRRIKADPRTSHIRVVALTGHAEPAHAKRALEAGCDDFVAKPCLPENLLAKVREHLLANDGKKKTQKGKK